MKILTLSKFISEARHHLGLTGLYGDEALSRELAKPSVRRLQPGDRTPAGGFLVAGPESFPFCRATEKRAAETCPEDLVSSQAAAVFFSDRRQPPESWIARCCRKPMLIGVSLYDEYLLESRLKRLVREAWSDVIMVHAGLVEIGGRGILLMGPAGSGKTGCAFQLARRGHRWIADDIVVLKKKGPRLLTGRAHRSLKGLFHQRDRGIQSMANVFGVASLRDEAVIHLIVDIDSTGGGPDEAGSAGDVRAMMGVPVPRVRWDAREGEASLAARLAAGRFS